jgi:PAS domain S-box-containing protein
MSAKSAKKSVQLSENMDLKASEDKFKFMFEHSIVGKSITFPSGEINVNRAFGEMLGYSREELSQKSWQEITYPEDIEPSQKVLDKVLSGEQDAMRLTKRYLHKAGSVIWAEVSTSLRRDETGQPLYFMTEVNDITERKQAEEALHESEERYKLMFESAPLAINITRGTEIIYANPSYLKMFGFLSLDELKNFTPLELFAPELRAQILENIQCRAKGLPVPNSYEAECYRKDRTRFTVLMHLTRTTFADGPATVGFILDITERKLAEEALQKSEARYAFIANNTKDVIWVLSLGTGKYTYVSPSVQKLRGYTPDEVMNQTMAESLTPESLQKTTALIQKRLANRKPGDTSSYTSITLADQPCKDGSVVSTEAVGTMVFDENGTPVEIIGISRDITERKQAEEALRESEKRLRLITDNMVDLIAQFDAQAFFQYVSPSYEKILGYRAEDLVGKSATDFLHPDERDKIIQAIDAMLRLGTGAVQFRYRHQNGSYLWIESTGRNLLNADGQVIGSTMGSRHITEQKRAEERLRKSEKDYRTLVENIQIGLVVHAPDTSILYSNPKASQLLGLTPDQMRGKAAIDPAWCFLQEDGARMPLDQYPVNQALTAETPITDLVLGILRPDREDPTWVQCNAHQDLGLEGKLQQVVVTFADITERKQAEKALRENELKYRTLFETADDANLLFTGDQWVDCNAGALRVFGCTREQIIGAHPRMFSPPMQPDGRSSKEESIKKIKLAFAGEPQFFEWEHCHADGTPFTAEVSLNRLDLEGKPYMQAIVRDISERKRAELKLKEYSEHLEELVEERTLELRKAQEQFIQQERLAVLGRLADSVSQELRNPLGIINNAVYYLRLVQPDEDETIKEYLDIIGSEAHNADKIVSDLLDFSSNELVGREPVTVSKLVRDALQLFPIPENVRATLDLPENLPAVYVDPRQMTQVLGNLVLNACQAMMDGGQLTVDGRQSTVDGQSSVVIAIKDTGSGITPENMQKLFEPLFTTKPKGIGLGLAVSKKLVEANGGKIEVESEPGKGSTFTVWMPVKP